MTISFGALRGASGRPTSASKPGRQRNTGGDVKYEVGRPHEKSPAATATQCKECAEKQASQPSPSGSGRRSRVVVAVLYAPEELTQVLADAEEDCAAAQNNYTT